MCRDPLASLLDSNTPNGARRDSGAGAGEYGVLLLEDAKDMPFVVALPSERGSVCVCVYDSAYMN